MQNYNTPSNSFESVPAQVQETQTLTSTQVLDQFKRETTRLAYQKSLEAKANKTVNTTNFELAQTLSYGEDVGPLYDSQLNRFCKEKDGYLSSSINEYGQFGCKEKNQTIGWPFNFGISNESVSVDYDAVNACNRFRNPIDRQENAYYGIISYPRYSQMEYVNGRCVGFR